MNRLLPVLALVCLFTVPSNAGETTGPPAPPPPPACTENCSSGSSETVPTIVVSVILGLITKLHG